MRGGVLIIWQLFWCRCEKNIFKNYLWSGLKHKMLSLLRWNTIIFLMEDPFKTVGYLLKKKNLIVFSSSIPEDFQHLSSDWVDFFFFQLDPRCYSISSLPPISMKLPCTVHSVYFTPTASNSTFFLREGFGTLTYPGPGPKQYAGIPVCQYASMPV